MTHVEVIRPHERISPELGGSGYLPPSVPSSADELFADLVKAERQSAMHGYIVETTVWKVARKGSRHPKRLTLPNGRYLKCRVIGGQQQWWFVAVNIFDGADALKVQ